LKLKGSLRKKVKLCFEEA